MPQMSCSRLHKILMFVLIAAALGLRLAFFAISTTNVPPSSDEALSPLQAKHILAGHMPLLVMANPYQFPVESYLYAAFVKFLPHNAFGARLIPFLEGVAAFLLLLFFLPHMGGWRSVWGAALLLVLPSAYVLMLLAGYALPQHNSVVLLAALGLCMAVWQRHARHCFWLAGGVGLICGLGFSNHALVGTLFFMVGVFVCVNSDWRAARGAAPAFIIGALIGLLPYFAALWLMPGAYAPVSATLPWRQALQKLISPVFRNVFAGVMGITPCYFPDTRETLSAPPVLRELFIWSWAAILMVATLWRIGAVVLDVRRRKWLVLHPVDICIGTTWLCAFAFAASGRSHSHTYRYLLPAAWCLPFVFGWLCASVSKPLRCALLILAVAFAGYNAMASALLMREWARPDFAEKHANIFDLKPVFDVLSANKIKYCYASYWSAYRLNYESGGKIVCSQPYNERFPGWELPYRDKVDQAVNVAYVLAPRHTFPSDRFEAHLLEMRVDCRRQHAGYYTIYSDFTVAPPAAAAEIVFSNVTASSSHNTAAAWMLTDGNRFTSWNSQHPQAQGMWIALSFPEPITISGLTLRGYGRNPRHPRRLRVKLLCDDVWTPVEADFLALTGPFEFVNGHPVYGLQSARIVFLKPMPASALRIEIDLPARTGHAWVLDEIEAFNF